MEDAWESNQYRRILCALLKRLGPQMVTHNEMRKTNEDIRSKTKGYGQQGGYEFFVKAK